ncbi:MAG: glycosyltransferase family 4 protein [Minisyncoccota bacterium]
MRSGKKKLTILVIAPTPFFSDRGTHIRILEEALALEKLGHQITIVTYHIGAELPENLQTTIEIRRIRRWLFWYKKLEAGPDWQKIVLDIMLIRKVFYLARTQRPDIIHGHLHEGVLIGWLVQKALFWRRMVLVGDFHGSLTKEMVSHQYLRFTGLHKVFALIERRINVLGDVAVASSWDNVTAMNIHDRQQKPAMLLLDGTRLVSDVEPTVIAEMRQAFAIPSEKVIITYTGALIANKGIPLLFDTIPLVCALYPQAHFVIAGFPIDQITSFLETAVFQQHVTIISPLSYFDLPKILSLSDIGVDPKISTTSQASGKMLQYMGAGLPIACFATENNREYLGEGGVYAKTMTAEGLAQAIGHLIDSKTLRDTKGQMNRLRAIDFSWEQSAFQLQDLYFQAMQKI